MRTEPLVYSCSGCSSAAQLANHLALRLDRLGVAEMSCVAGLGGDVEPLVRLARRGRPLVALDGCPLHCVRRCLARHDLAPALHVTLTELGIAKRAHMDFDPADAERLLAVLRSRIGALVDGPAQPAMAPAGRS
ncbi:MAG: putative zinc-binding protein [Deltaproteobacteria bacterium]|nr:putative zinc-binding protein [Kofleriaceae bacterium]